MSDAEVRLPLRYAQDSNSLQAHNLPSYTAIFNTIVSMLAECIVIVTTWARTVGVVRMLSKRNLKSRGVTYLMFRDGNYYVLRLFSVYINKASVDRSVRACVGSVYFV